MSKTMYCFNNSRRGSLSEAMKACARTAKSNMELLYVGAMFSPTSGDRALRTSTIRFEVDVPMRPRDFWTRVHGMTHAGTPTKVGFGIAPETPRGVPELLAPETALLPGESVSYDVVGRREQVGSRSVAAVRTRRGGFCSIRAHSSSSASGACTDA